MMAARSAGDGPTRWIELEGAANARVVVPGVLLRSDNLRTLTHADVDRLVREHGLEGVIDLRSDAEVARDGTGLLAAAGVHVAHLSLFRETPRGHVVDPTMLWPEAAKPTAELAREDFARAYIAYLRRRPDSAVAAARLIARADGAVLVHCAAGKDRTGTIVALTLAACGVPVGEIEADYMASEGRMEAIFALLARSATYGKKVAGEVPHDHVPRAGTMRRFLQLIDSELGGADAWLLRGGLVPEDLMRLRARVRQAR
jgi:protein-tyrosine phosphatase